MSFSDILSLIGCLFGVIGIVLAIVFYLKSRRTKKLSFDAKAFGLLSDTTSSLQGFSASYGGNYLSRLTAAKILVWNSGTDIIQASDIAESDPIRLCLPNNCQILGSIVSASSTPTNKVSVAVAPNLMNELIVSFDYFGLREGCLISILHTGQETDALAVAGTIKGSGQPTKYLPRKFLSVLDKLVPLTAGIFGGVVFPILIQEKLWRWWVWVPALLLMISGIVVTGAWVSKQLTRKTGGSLDKEFRGDFLPSEFTQPTHAPKKPGDA